MAILVLSPVGLTIWHHWEKVIFSVIYIYLCDKSNSCDSSDNIDSSVISDSSNSSKKKWHLNNLWEVLMAAFCDYGIAFLTISVKGIIRNWI